MTQATLLQWDESLGSRGLGAAGTRVVPSVTNTSAAFLQVISAQTRTCSSLCQGGRLIELVFVPAVFVSPGMIPVSHLEPLQGHMSLLEQDIGMAPLGCGASCFACVTNTIPQKCSESLMPPRFQLFIIFLHFPHENQCSQVCSCWQLLPLSVLLSSKLWFHMQLERFTPLCVSPYTGILSEYCGALS